MNNQNPRNISSIELNVWLNDQSKIISLVDVREANELAIASFSSHVIHLPLSQMSVWSGLIGETLPIDIPVVVICHRGIRSFNFGSWLIQKGLGHEVWNLEGGIDSWSVEVDSSIPRY